MSNEISFVMQMISACVALYKDTGVMATGGGKQLINYYKYKVVHFVCIGGNT